MSRLPDQQYLWECFTYDGSTGNLIWKVRPFNHFSSVRIARGVNTRFAGKQALASLDSHGYFQGAINCRMYLAHRIIWKYVTGEEPLIVDHSDRVATNNRWNNLRAADHSSNQININRPRASSGYAGVHQNKRNGKWIARISKKHKRYYLGEFPDREEAASVRRRAALDLYGDFVP